MSRDSERHETADSSTTRRDVLKGIGGTAAAGALGALGTGTAAAAPSFDAAFLTDDVDLNFYQHHHLGVYSPGDDRTYLTYQSVDTGGTSTTTDDTDGDAYIVAYDHSTGAVTGPHRVGLNPLNAGDTHGVPTLTIDDSGYVHVFFGSHGGYNTKLGGADYDNVQYARSENTYDITSWIYPPDGTTGAGPLPTPPGTYTCPTTDSNGDVYVLYRAGNGSGGYPSHEHATLARSTDNGQTWTDVNDGVLDFTDGPWTEACAYVASAEAFQGRVHLTWSISEDDNHGDERRHLFHAAYNPSTGNMETMSGTDLGSEVSYSEAHNYCKVKDTGTTHINSKSSGNAHIVYDDATDTAYVALRYPVDSTTSQLRVYSYADVSNESSTWQESNQITTTNDPINLKCHLRINESGQLEVTDQQGNNGIWRKESGTWNHYDYTGGTAEIDNITRVVRNGKDDFAWWGRSKQQDAQGDDRYNTWALGLGQASGAGASESGTRAPKNLRVTSSDSSGATIDWDHGLAGTSGVDKYKVYVDGTHQTDVTTQPTVQPYPRTWADLSLGGGSHDIEVSLVNGNNTESATSNTVTVNVDTTTDELEVHYPFDESSGASTAQDSSGNDRDATVGTGVTTGVSGQDGSAFDFDGTSTATVVDDDGEAYINGLDEITISAWVKSDTTGNDRGIFNGVADGGNSADNDVGVRYDSTGYNSGNTNCLKAGIRYDDGTGTIQSASVETEGGLQTTNWQHVTYTWQAGDQVRIYVDGSEVTYGATTSTPSGATIAEQSAFAVGEAVLNDAWDGKIDDVKVHSYRLSDSEIANLASTSTDSTAPTAPSNLSSPAHDSTSVDLDWDASSDTGGSGLDHYNVYVDGTKDQEVASGTTQATVTGLSSGTSYDFHVTAVDGASNESGDSNTVTVTTDSSSGPTPVTHYTFDESSGASTATDSAGDDDATINGGVTAGVSGKDGTAFDFDGSSTATVVDADAESYINGQSAFSVAMWIQSDSATSNRGLFNCVDDGGDDSDGDVGMRYDDYGWNSGNNYCIKAGVRYDDGTGTVSSAQIETEGNVQTTNWQHVVYTWEAGDQVRIYVDGSEVTYGSSTSTPSGATIAQQDAFVVGGPFRTYEWDGKIDDVRVYDQALTSSEVSTLYNSY